jgi:DNA-binding NtrC family response regulator
MHRILIVDDELGVRHSFQKAFGKEHRVEMAADGNAAIEAIAKAPPDLVLMDIKMPGISGIEALRTIKQSHPDVPVVMMTAYGDTQKAIEAMKLGALDYLLKPLRKSDVQHAIAKAFRVRRILQKPNLSYLERGAGDEKNILVGNSESMVQVYKLIGQVAQTDVTVLIQGESGTGKELIARAIYENSQRSAKPFVVANCAALAEGLLETELFGYERGAFTGASDKPKLGKFEVCNEGTFLLDEIGDMSLFTQAKVLRVLQSGEIQKVGSVENIHVDVRILAATNKNLEEEIQEGRFREDLFHRINVFCIDVPPLRDRKQDIPDLARYMIGRFNRQLRVEIKGYTRDFLERLESFEWPGNVRELENVVKKAMVVCQTNILSVDDCHLPRETGIDVPGAGRERELSRVARRMLRQGFAASDRPLDEIVRQVEKALIEEALEMTHGNQLRASHLLGIARTTLRKKIDDYGIGEQPVV